MLGGPPLLTWLCGRHEYFLSRPVAFCALSYSLWANVTHWDSRCRPRGPGPTSLSEGPPGTSKVVLRRWDGSGDGRKKVGPGSLRAVTGTLTPLLTAGPQRCRQTHVRPCPQDPGRPAPQPHPGPAAPLPTHSSWPRAAHLLSKQHSGSTCSRPRLQLLNLRGRQAGDRHSAPAPLHPGWTRAWPLSSTSDLLEPSTPPAPTPRTGSTWHPSALLEIRPRAAARWADYHQPHARPRPRFLTFCRKSCLQLRQGAHADGPGAHPSTVPYCSVTTAGSC